MSDVQRRIDSILVEVAKSKDWSNYEVITHTDALKGDGFLSEFYTGEVQNKDTGEHITTYIKVPPPRGYDFIPDAYANEYHFYSKIVPALESFQKERRIEERFNKTCKFYAGRAEPPAYLVFENLQKLNFVLYDKKEFANEKHLRHIFRTYGKYHALTFAFKDQNRETYEELLKPVKFLFPAILNKHVHDFMNKIYQLGYEALKEIDDEKGDRAKILIDDAKTSYYKRGFPYEGRHSGLIHGDCWSNNIMYKYDSHGDIEDLRMIDHQLLCDSTPIHDLSYFFYAAAAKKDLDRLHDYLDLYHGSFSEFARELGSDPDRLLPLAVLKSEWKKYAPFGMNMAFMVWQIKLMPKEEIGQVTDGQNEEEVFHEHFERLLQEGKYKGIIRDILLHAIDFDII